MCMYAVRVMSQETEGLGDEGRDRKEPGYDAFSSLLPTVWHLIQSI